MRPGIFVTIGAAVTLIAAFTAASFLAPSRLVIADADTGYIFWQRKLHKGDEFSVEFVHSVNKTPVRDTFRVTGTLIQPVSTLFYNFGAGMQTDLEDGQQLTRQGDALVISGFTQSFSELNFIVGTVSDHILGFGGEEISLRDLCGRNAHVTFRVARSFMRVRGYYVR